MNNDCSNDMRAVYADIEKEMREQDEKNAAVLNTVKEKVSPIVFSEILAYLEESDWNCDFSIEPIPVGCKMDDGYSFGEYYVNQTCNGGYSGDSFAGTVSINIGTNEWFQFHYSM